MLCPDMQSDRRAARLTFSKDAWLRGEYLQDKGGAFPGLQCNPALLA